MSEFTRNCIFIWNHFFDKFQMKKFAIIIFYFNSKTMGIKLEKWEGWVHTLKENMWSSFIIHGIYSIVQIPFVEMQLCSLYKYNSFQKKFSVLFYFNIEFLFSQFLKNFYIFIHIPQFKIFAFEIYMIAHIFNE